MSLEKALEEHTKVLEESIKAMNRLTNTLLSKAPSQEAEAEAPAKKSAPKKAASTTQEQPTTKTDSEPTKDESPSETTPPYEDVRQATLKLVASKGKPAAVKLLSSYKVEKAHEIDEKLWGKYILDIEALLGDDEDVA